MFLRNEPMKGKRSGKQARLGPRDSKLPKRTDGFPLERRGKRGALGIIPLGKIDTTENGNHAHLKKKCSEKGGKDRRMAGEGKGQEEPVLTTRILKRGE